MMVSLASFELSMEQNFHIPLLMKIPENDHDDIVGFVGDLIQHKS